MATTTQSGHRFVAKAALEPGYDGDGNLTADGRWDYQWDGENRLTAMTTTTIAQTAGVPYQRLVFSYDGQGRRVRKQVFDSPTGAATDDLRFLYDGWNLLIEYRKTGSSAPAVLRSYLWGQDLAGIDFSGQPTQGAGGVGGLLGVTTGGNSYLPAYDGNGNIVAWLNSSNQLVSKQEYDPFGNRIIHEGSVDLPIGFSTKYRDEETNLLYYGYRYYDPATGRWPSRDPIEEAGGVNLYGFVKNGPSNGIDILGNAMLNWGSMTFVYPKTGKANLAYLRFVRGEVTRILRQIGVSISIKNSVQVPDSEKMPYAIWLETSIFYKSTDELNIKYALDRLSDYWKASNPILISDTRSNYDPVGWTYPEGINVAYQSPMAMARIIAHEIIHYKTGFEHGNTGEFSGWDKKRSDGRPYLTSGGTVKEYGEASIEVISCTVANWIRTKGGTPDPKFVDKSVSP